MLTTGCDVRPPGLPSPQTLLLWTEMASLLQPDRVAYLVRGEKRLRAPLSQLYFCRYCSELRSLECVSHEVGNHSRVTLWVWVLQAVAAAALASYWAVSPGARCALEAGLSEALLGVWLSYLSIQSASHKRVFLLAASDSSFRVGWSHC